MVQNPPASAGDLVRTLGQEEPLEKETATHFSILAWETPCTEEPGQLQSMELQRVGHNLAPNNNNRVLHVQFKSLSFMKPYIGGIIIAAFLQMRKGRVEEVTYTCPRAPRQ